MVVCVSCGTKVDSLFHVYAKDNCCLSKCGNCGSITDKYVEWDSSIVVIEVFLFKKELYRHLVYNQSSRPFVKDEKHARVKVLLKLFSLYISSVILDTCSMAISNKSSKNVQEWCRDEFSLRNQRSLSYFTFHFWKSGVSDTGVSDSPFVYKNIDNSLLDDNESVYEVLNKMNKSALYYSLLQVSKRCKNTDEHTHNDYIMNLISMIVLQTPQDCDDEISLLILSGSRLLIYLLYIALLCFIIERDKACLNTSMDVIFALLLCIHAKALVLMMNIWFPRLSVLIAVELYIYISNVVGILAIYNVSLKYATFIVTSGIFVKILVYLTWLNLPKLIS